jgi:hypothetical protein
MTTPLIKSSERLTSIAYALASPGLADPCHVLKELDDVPALLATWQDALERLKAELRAECDELEKAYAREKGPPP